MSRLRGAHRDVEESERARGWFQGADDIEARLSDPQRRLLHAARARLEGLSPPTAKPSESWAAFEPLFDSEHYSLLLCVPILGRRHESLQLGLWGQTIVGGWQDRHYAWDYPNGEAFRAELTEGIEHGPINDALDWLEVELRGQVLRGREFRHQWSLLDSETRRKAVRLALGGEAADDPRTARLVVSLADSWVTRSWWSIVFAICLFGCFELALFTLAMPAGAIFRFWWLWAPIGVWLTVVLPILVLRARHAAELNREFLRSNG